MTPLDIEAMFPPDPDLMASPEGDTRGLKELQDAARARRNALLLPTEATWTRPRPDCPHPERWHAPDEQATETEVTELVAAMVRALQPDLCIETGSWVGATTAAIGHALVRNGHGRLVSLEIDIDKAAEAADRCEGLPVTVLARSSLDWTPPEPVDFAWFDSDCAARPWEFWRYLPRMHDRTVVGFHDTGPQHPVRALLAPLERSGVIQPLYLPTPRGVMFARVAPEFR